MATGRIRLHIWEFRPKDYCLGSSAPYQLYKTYSWPFTTFHQDADGKIRDIWDPIAIRITELSLTPDFKYLVALGMEFLSITPPTTEPTHQEM
jgi:hypothetical protein